MEKHSVIRNFVRHTLGCTCPESVFEQIEDRQVVAGTSPHTRSITIGGRLLIYVWIIRGSEGLEEKFAAMLAAGLKERDARGLNRFRAVLVANNPLAIEMQLHRQFLQFPGRDDCVHFHVVSGDNLDIL